MPEDKSSKLKLSVQRFLRTFTTGLGGAYANPLSLLSRIAAGERLERSSPAELRWLSGFLVMLPVFAVSFLHFGRNILDHASAIGIWFLFVVTILAGFLFAIAWGRWVPLIMSWGIAAILWVIFLWLALTDRFLSL